MKKILLLSILSVVSLTSQAQWSESTTKLTTSKDVGIGISDPAYKLDVAGDIRSRNVIIPQGYRLTRDINDNFTYQDNVLGQYSISWNRDTWNPTSGTLWQSGYGGIKFFTGGEMRVAVTRSGNVGVGTDSPAHKLDVNGNVRTQNVVLPQGYQLTRDLNDTFTYQDKAIGQYSIGWNADSWYTSAGTLWQSGYGGVKFFTGGDVRLAITRSGNIGVGTDNPKNKLDVAGTIRATEVKVEALPWADFVFNENYKLRSLEEVKAHIEEHKHLPDIPSEADVKENGVSLGEMQAKLLQKIEELTLYVIKQDEKNKALEKEIQSLKFILAKE